MDPIQILDQVNEFYTTAFGNLMYLTIAIFSISGIILPLILQNIQSKSLEKERKLLESQFNDSVKLVKVELHNEIEEKFESEKAKLREEINADICLAKGIGFSIQGTERLKSEDYVNAANHYISAISYALDGKDEHNAKKFLDLLVNMILPKINQEKYQDDIELQIKIPNFLEKLDNLNVNRRYETEILSIKKFLKSVE